MTFGPKLVSKFLCGVPLKNGGIFTQNVLFSVENEQLVTMYGRVHFRSGKKRRIGGLLT